MDIPKKMPLNWKDAYWIKKGLLNDNVHIDQKCTYWIKMCLLTKKLPTEWKYAYWPKICILNECICKMVIIL